MKSNRSDVLITAIIAGAILIGITVVGIYAYFESRVVAQCIATAGDMEKAALCKTLDD